MRDFTVKDSGERIEYESGMRRDIQTGKPRYDLITPLDSEDNMLTRIAVHMAKGAEKYGDRNWEKANSKEEMDRFKASACRHFFQWLFGFTDEDHAAATFFNVQAFEFVKRRLRQ